MTEKGIVNGASFNYGTDGPRHWDLDVDPISRHDPQFRRDTLKGFRSPKRVFRQWFRAQKMTLCSLILMPKDFCLPQQE